MKFTLEIKCDNAAFEPDPSTETARILEEVSRRVDSDSSTSGTVRDINGNTVAQYAFEEGS